MAKSRAQRKAEQRRKRQGQPSQSQAGQSTDSGDAPTDAADGAAEQSSPDSSPARNVVPAASSTPEPVAPSPDTESKEPVEDRITRRQRKADERDRKQRAKESERRRQGGDAVVEKERGAISGFFRSVASELNRVQWPDRDTLVQATGVTIVFVAVAAAYLGALDAVFSRLIQLII